jgi:hypothetical protein
MNHSAFPQIRVSSLVLIAGLTFVADATGASSAKNLQTLANEASAQIDLAYRQHPSERDLRKQQLTEALKSWRVAEHDTSNNERLANWLHAAIVNSMPGSQDPLPALPAFTAAAKIREPESASEAAVKAAPAVNAKAEADPFRDDPVNAAK